MYKSLFSLLCVVVLGSGCFPEQPAKPRSRENPKQTEVKSENLRKVKEEIARNTTLGSCVYTGTTTGIRVCYVNSFLYDLSDKRAEIVNQARERCLAWGTPGTAVAFNEGVACERGDIVGMCRFLGSQNELIIDMYQQMSEDRARVFCENAGGHFSQLAVIVPGPGPRK